MLLRRSKRISEMDGRALEQKYARCPVMSCTRISRSHPKFVVACRASFRELTVILSKVWNHSLCIAFGPQGAGLQQWLLEVDAARVHVEAGSHVVKGVDHKIH